MSPSSRRGGSKPSPSSGAKAPARPPAPAPVPSPADEPPDEEPPIGIADGGGRFGRLGAGAGAAYAVLGFIGSSLLPVGKVDPTDPADVIARHLVEERGRVSGGILLTLFSLFFLLVFVAWLHSWLRDVEGGGGWLATLALVGGVLMVAMMSVIVLLAIGSTVLDDYGGDVVIARTLLVLQWQAVGIVFVPTAAFVGATGLVVYRSGVLPRWLAYSGMAIAVGLLIPPLAFLPFLLSTLWTGLLAVVLLQRSRYA